MQNEKKVPSSTALPKYLSSPETPKEIEARLLHRKFQKILDDPKASPRQKAEAERGQEMVAGMIAARRVNHTETWALADRDRSLLTDLRYAIRGLTKFTCCGSDLIALGEAWDALDQILDDPVCEIEYILTLSIGYRRGDRDFSEGLFLNIRIDDEKGVVLDELNASYSSDVGSDHFTVDFTSMDRERRFDLVDFGRWMEKFEEVRLEEDAFLSTSRDHV